MCKEDENGLSVGLWNLSVDKITAPIVTLSSEFESVETNNCIEKIDGDKVTLSALYPFEFCDFTVCGKKYKLIFLKTI